MILKVRLDDARGPVKKGLVHQRKHVRSADLSIQLILETDNAHVDSIQAVCSSSESKKFPECKINLEYEIG